jgi:hypothetical protein
MNGAGAILTGSKSGPLIVLNGRCFEKIIINEWVVKMAQGVL